MRYILIALALAGCASAPSKLVAINDAVNNKATYVFYRSNSPDFLNLSGKPIGNCMAFASHKAEMARALGYEARIEKCRVNLADLNCSYNGITKVCPYINSKEEVLHAVSVVVDSGQEWVLDGAWVESYDNRKCR